PRGYLMGARCRRPRPTLTRPRPELPLPTAALDSPTARPVTSGGSDGEVRQEAHSRRPGVRVHRRGADGRAARPDRRLAHGDEPRPLRAGRADALALASR